MEKSWIIAPEDVVDLFGANHSHIQQLDQFYPTLKITVRGNEIKISGTESEMGKFEETLQKMNLYLSKFGSLSERELEHILTEPSDIFLEKKGESYYFSEY